jgi:two-component system sensor histidine kinase RpfC
MTDSVTSIMVEGGIAGEQAMAFNRFVAGAFVVPLVLFAAPYRGLPLSLTFIPLAAYLACAFAILVNVRTRPDTAFPRRALALIMDAAGVSFELHLGGSSSAILYSAYLWVIFGNGFRFGNRYLFAASTACIAGFSAVIATTPFWQGMPSLSTGLIVSQLVLPGYASVLIARLQAARRRAEEASRVKTLFLASISHELRTPLNAIIGLGELLTTTALTAEQANMLATISVSAETQLELIEDLLHFTRLDAGQVQVSDAPLDLGRLLAEVQGLMSLQARKKGLLLNTFVTSRTPLWIRGDGRHLRQVLLNLCSNAIKFTESGSVTVSVDGTGSGPDAIRLRFEVADTGIGIAPEARPRIFQMFTQADVTVMNRYGGTGMGLAIVDRLVRRMGGEVGVESDLGQGSTFWITLDVARDASATGGDAAGGDAAGRLPERVVSVSSASARAHALAGRVARLGIRVETAPGLEALAAAAPCVILFDERSAWPEHATLWPPATCPIVAVRGEAQPGLPRRALRERFATAVAEFGPEDELRRALCIAAAHLPPQGKNQPPVPASSVVSVRLRVLVADDNRINQLVTTKVLENAGHSVVVAGDGEEALDVLTGEKVDLALMDVNMPVLSGIQAAQMYQFTVLDGPHVPLIGVTADASPETMQLCLDAGMAACLVKPVRAAELLRAIEDTGAGQQAPLPHGVTAIAEHPGFRAAQPQSQPSPVDAQMLADLAALGGEGFVARVVREFVEEAEGTIASLERAAAARDIDRFRADAHALCSSGSNVGATALRAVCDPWQHMPPSELAGAGPELVARLRQEWQRTRDALDQAAKPG